MRYDSADWAVKEAATGWVLKLADMPAYCGAPRGARPFSCRTVFFGSVHRVDRDRERRRNDARVGRLDADRRRLLTLKRQGSEAPHRRLLGIPMQVVVPSVS